MGVSAPHAIGASFRAVGPAGAFFVYMAATLVAPTAYLIWSSVNTPAGLGLERYITVLTDPFYLRGFRNSFGLSLLTALEASAAGALLAGSFAYSLPIRSKRLLLAFSNLATNLGGVSLAFAFIALMGTNGMLTIGLRELFGINLYPGFDVASFAGLNLVYVYHLTPFAFLDFVASLSRHPSAMDRSCADARGHSEPVLETCRRTCAVALVLSNFHPDFRQRIRHLLDRDGAHGWARKPHSIADRFPLRRGRVRYGTS